MSDRQMRSQQHRHPKFFFFCFFLWQQRFACSSGCVKHSFRVGMVSWNEDQASDSGGTTPLESNSWQQTQACVDLWSIDGKLIGKAQQPANDLPDSALETVVFWIGLPLACPVADHQQAAACS